ncbi:MAG: hypothetical protein LBJ18_02740 [Rickettsiales bacterium]|jgi:hypothetical protein|nr:hypothetical protein [Rickettsiales bacterium]
MKYKLILCLFALCACSNVANINYQNTGDGCVYSEVYRPKQWIGDWFGVRDSDIYVNYSGVKCETIINQELKDNTHKKPYNSISSHNEVHPAIIVR